MYEYKGEKMKSTIQAIEDDIRMACLSFKSIAIKHGVSINDVTLVWEQMCEQEFNHH